MHKKKINSKKWNISIILQQTYHLYQKRKEWRVNPHHEVMLILFSITASPPRLQVNVEFRIRRVINHPIDVEGNILVYIELSWPSTGFVEPDIYKSNYIM